MSTTTGDPVQLQNAILNIALNARDAMPDGGILSFKTELVSVDDHFVSSHHDDIRPGPYIRISVTDTGSGIEKEVQEHIFEPFYTTKEVGKGTGMGLASVYGTVKNHKGAIGVYSEPGVGTEIKIYLPLTSGGTLIPHAAPARVVRGNANILVVDDDPVLQEFAEEMLIQIGYKVHVCHHGREAVEYYQTHHAEIDLVILDMIMPVMNGKDAAIAMHQINPGVRILLSSGYSLNEEAQRLLDQGIAQGFIGKPYRRSELVNTINEVLAD
jgi:CheY-like chemotaxis protein